MKGHSSEPWLCPRPNVPGWRSASHAPITGKTRPHSSNGAPEVAHDAVTSVGRSASGRVSQLKGLFSRSVHFVAVVSAGGASCRSVRVAAATDAMIDNEQAKWSRKPKHTTFGQRGAHGNSKPPPRRAFTFARWVGSVSGRFLFVTTLRLVSTASYLSCTKNSYSTHIEFLSCFSVTLLSGREEF